jgi:hypothetical protein
MHQVGSAFQENAINPTIACTRRSAGFIRFSSPAFDYPEFPHAYVLTTTQFHPIFAYASALRQALARFR